MEEMSPVICPALAGMIRKSFASNIRIRHVPCTRGDSWFGTGRSRSVPNRLFGHAAFIAQPSVAQPSSLRDRVGGHLRHPSSVIRHPSSVIRHPLFVIKPRCIKPRYISPCAVIAVATLRKPAALAPSIRSPASP